MSTTFDNQCLILQEVWMEYRDSDDMAEFMDYFDLAFPLAFSFREGIATPTETGKTVINDCWVSLLGSLGVNEDTGFESLEDLISLGPDVEED